MSKLDKQYSNEKITVFWKPGLCTHSRRCFTGLISVFNPSQRPWIDLSGADNESIIRTVKNCPSGALSFKYNVQSPESAPSPKEE